jgi:hypothetical protein
MASKPSQQRLLEDDGAAAPAEVAKAQPTAAEAHRSRMLLISFTLMCVVGVGNR